MSSNFIKSKHLLFKPVWIWTIAWLLLLHSVYGQGRNLKEQVEIRDRFNLAVNLYHQKSYKLAIPYFLEVLKKDSQHFFGRYYLGLSFFRIGQTDEAIREMENIIRIHGLNRNLEKKINFFSQQKFLELPRRNFNRYVWIRDYPNPEAQMSSLGNTLNPFTILRNQGYQIRTPIHIQVKRNHELLVLDFSLKRFFRLDGDGVILGDVYQSFSPSSGQERLSGPWAFAPFTPSNQPGNSASEGYWITDFLNDNIKVIDAQGRVTSVIGTKGIGETNFLGIKGITTDENGNFYIVDSGNGRIQFRNQQGEWLKNIGQRGDVPGALLNPIDIAYDPMRQQLYVLDKGNKKIVVFSQEGGLLNELSTESLGIQLHNEVGNPQKLYWDNPQKPEYLYLLDAKSLYRLHLGDLKWEWIELNRQPGALQFISMAMGEDGYIYLGNALREKIEVFAPVEKTYINLPVLVKSINTQNFPTVQLEVGVKDLVGYPIKFLQSRNFSLYENNVAIPFKLSPPPSSRRIILLMEKSSAAQEREYTAKAFMEALYDQLRGDEGIKVITYNRNGHSEQTPFTRFKLAAMEKALDPNGYTPDFVADEALLTTVNYFKGGGIKPAVVMLVFTPHEAEHFQNRYINIVQTLKNNDIPVYVFYAGPDALNSNFFYLRNLSQQTRGQFYIFDENSLSRFENDFNNYHNGNYILQYLTTFDPRNRGVFRRVAVDVRYKNTQGEDSLVGYPLP